MGRMYEIPFTEASLSAVADILELNAATDRPLTVHELYLGQVTLVGDAAEILARIDWITAHSTSGSGGTAEVESPLDSDDVAAGFNAETFNTTVATGGSPVTRRSFVWNLRIPLQMIWTPETRPRLNGGERGVFALQDDPGTSVVCSGYAVVEEL